MKSCMDSTKDKLCYRRSCPKEGRSLSWAAQVAFHLPLRPYIWWFSNLGKVSLDIPISLSPQPDYLTNTPVTQSSTIPARMPENTAMGMGWRAVSLRMSFAIS